MGLDWPAFADALWLVNDELGIRPEWQLAVISLETAGTFDPATVNPYGCAGLNQLCRSTYLHYVSVPVDTYRAWPASAQLAGPIRAYWRDALAYGPIRSSGRLMLAQLGHNLLTLPDSPDTVVFASPSNEYLSNRSLDGGNKGYITLQDLQNATSYREHTPAVRDALAMAYAIRQNPPSRSVSKVGVVLGVVALTAAAAYGANRFTRTRYA